MTKKVLCKIKAIKLHHLSPGSDKVMQEALFAILACINLRNRAKLCIRSKDQIHNRGRPLLNARLTIVSFEHTSLRGRWLPSRLHREQVHKEVVGQRLLAFGQYTMSACSEICTQHAQTADQNRHLWRCKREQLRLIEQ